MVPRALGMVLPWLFHVVDIVFHTLIMVLLVLVLVHTKWLPRPMVLQWLLSGLLPLLLSRVVLPMLG